MPRAMPPSQIRTANPSAQRNDVTPCENAGRCIASECTSRLFRTRRQKKFTEPVALSSPEPVGFPLPRTALRPGFDLLALRARCKGDSTACTYPLQDVGERKDRCLHTFPFAHGERANRAGCSKGAGP